MRNEMQRMVAVHSRKSSSTGLWNIPHAKGNIAFVTTADRFPALRDRPPGVFAGVRDLDVEGKPRERGGRHGRAEAVVIGD